MDIQFIKSTDADHLMNWQMICDAIIAGHKLPKATLGDQFLDCGNKTLLSRAAAIQGLGQGVKSVTVSPDNPQRNLPTVQGAMLIFDDETGTPKAMIESDIVTKWKTAGDSVLGAKLLANPEPENLLIVGAGTVGDNLIDAYRAIFPSIKNVSIWNRTFKNAEKLAAKKDAHAVENLAEACGQNDIVSAATYCLEPLIKGEWIKLGTHVDLIGAFKADMREADDALLQKARIFVDSFETTVEHIGELIIPLASGAIERSAVLGDFYDLVKNSVGRQSKDEITVFKNGGGAHLDLMVADRIWKAMN
ncbi:Gfo/Idh/MocA family oxidoreductase [Ahrensia kielensis]|uniref:Gfo/Idh/MocA family oxidoreductase n=1 Tax=Ahrensia kielensis TaxID=76980 RepID=A0ABU9T949_9HYPH